MHRADIFNYILPKGASTIFFWNFELPCILRLRQKEDWKRVVVFLPYRRFSAYPIRLSLILYAKPPPLEVLLCTTWTTPSVLTDLRKATVINSLFIVFGKARKGFGIWGRRGANFSLFLTSGVMWATWPEFLSKSEKKKLSPLNSYFSTLTL